MGAFFDWFFQFFPEWLVIPWARGTVAVGSFLLIFATGLAVHHYGFGGSITDGRTGEPATPRLIFCALFVLGGVGAFIAVYGILVLRWKS